MDAYTLELKKLLADHQAPQVMRSLIDTLQEAGKSSPQLKRVVEPLQTDIIMLSSRLSKVLKEQEQNLINVSDARIELARIDQSLLKTLNSLDEDYPGLEEYFLEREEESAWAIASTSNDIETYQNFFNKYPNGKYKDETQQVIKELKALEIQKNVEIRKAAEAERQRRQTNQTKTNQPTKNQIKPKTSTSKYYLIGFGFLALIAASYFILRSINSPKRIKIAPVREVFEEGDPKENIATEKEVPEIKKEFVPSIRNWLGTWTTDRGTMQLLVSGSRVYGDLGSSGIIEATYNRDTKILTGQVISNGKREAFGLRIRGWQSGKTQTWEFSSSSSNMKWSGTQSSQSSPSIQNFPWVGKWSTSLGTASFTQKANRVTGNLSGGEINGRIDATYDPQSKKLRGKIQSSKTPGTFTLVLNGNRAFSGSSVVEIKLPFVKQKIPKPWTGKRTN